MMAKSYTTVYREIPGGAVPYGPSYGETVIEYDIFFLTRGPIKTIIQWAPPSVDLVTILQIGRTLSLPS